MTDSAPPPPVGEHYRPSPGFASFPKGPQGSPPKPTESSRSWWAGLLAMAALALGKLKGLLVLLKALPAGKLLLTTGSMIAMVALEAVRGGWAFGVGFVLLILIHELGHGYAMKRHGVAAGWPIFIPFFGAMIAMKEAPKDRHIEAEIAYGGPYAGTLASLIVAALALYFHSRLMLVLAYTGFFLNLFNLTPLSPLDGGRVAQAFSKRAWIIGLLLMGGLLIITGTPQLLLIVVMALPRVFGRDADQREALSEGQRRLWVTRYFGLCGFLALAMYFSGQILHR